MDRAGAALSRWRSGQVCTARLIRGTRRGDYLNLTVLTMDWPPIELERLADVSLRLAAASGLGGLLGLERELHEWRAGFNFVRNPNGNFAFYFSIYLSDLPDLKFDYDQTTFEQ